MSAELTIGSSNSIDKGVQVYTEGEPLTSVALILKGRVAVRSEGVLVTLGSGNFLGITDIDKGEHSFTYIAGDNLVVYPLPITDQVRVKKLIDEKAQYRGLLVTSLNFFIYDLNKNMKKLKDAVYDLNEYLIKGYEKYSGYTVEAGLVPEPIPAIERIVAQKIEDPSLPSGLRYYLEISRIEVETQRKFIGARSYVAYEHLKEQSAMIEPLRAACRYYGEWLYRLFRALIMDEKNLFSNVGRTALDLKKAGQDTSNLSDMMDDIIGRIDASEKLLRENVGTDPKLNRTHMEKMYMALLSDDESDIAAVDEVDLHMLSGATDKIIEYSGIDSEKAKEFKEGIEAFLGLTDKFARTKDATAIRKKISGPFFDIYEGAVKRSFKDDKIPPAVRLFLDYGFAHEELLTEEDLRTLLDMPEVGSGQMDCHVYPLREWLREIYEGRKNPSKDEFDEDYEEHARKDTAKGDPKEFDKIMSDGDAKLHFEIDKLVRYADRLVSGNISTFVPVLCSEGIMTTLSSAPVTGAAVNAAVRKIEKIDYSIFYREVRDYYEEIDVNNFTNIERYTPDFILFPICGGGAQMWQDTEGRKKTSHARILMPMLAESDIDSMMIRLMAHFRWEKCRTEMGAQWNNYRYPSLTSEYTDYLQFYKKNSDLSPEKKEKVKAQLSQAGNRHRDVFAKDYTDWIQKEAAGAMRLNKVARDILFTYCPISQDIAAGLISQTAYADAAKRYTVEKKKAEKNINNVIHKFEKNAIDVPEEIRQTMKYLLDS